MKLKDVIIVFTLLISLFIFFKTDMNFKKGSIKIYDKGKDDFLELNFINPFNETIFCDVLIKINTNETLYTNQSFISGNSFTNYSIVLPDGKNEVFVDVKC